MTELGENLPFFSHPITVAFPVRWIAGTAKENAQTGRQRSSQFLACLLLPPFSVSRPGRVGDRQHRSLPRQREEELNS
jgi:hypothetical protein